jgi:hypothetical protein
MLWYEPNMTRTCLIFLLLSAAIALALGAVTGCVEGSGSTSVMLSGHVTQYMPGSPEAGAPIDGVAVCQFRSNNCALTDENGEYELPLLMNREVLISHAKEGYGPVLVARRSGVQDLNGDAVMATDAVMAEFADAIGTPYPPLNSGFVSMTAYRGSVSDDTRLAGASFALSGSDGLSYYLNDAGAPDTTLTETQAHGTGGFVEVAPVDVSLQVFGAANCTSDESWVAAGTNAFKLPIRAGFWTQSRVSCE